MVEALAQLFGSRKFLVMLFAQLALAVPAYFKVITPELAAEIGSGLVGAWMVAHAHEEKSKVEAKAATDGLYALASDMGKRLPALPENAGPSTQGVK